MDGVDAGNAVVVGSGRRADLCSRVGMLAKTETESVAATADAWLAQFERALAEPDDVLLKTLFHADSHWRDVLALTWHIRTVNGLHAIARELKGYVGRAQPTGFKTAPHRTAPRHVTGAGLGSGVLRLTPDANQGNTLKAWTLLTPLDELRRFGEQAGRSRSQGKS